MQPWLLGALFALVAWSIQRLLGKIALGTLGTKKFYLLSATVSLLTYTPYLILHPPALQQLAPAFGLSCLMAVTFGVTTEAIRRGPLGVVSPITGLSPVLTAVLAVTLLSERLDWPTVLGVGSAPLGVFLLGWQARQCDSSGSGWLGLALLSLLLQGVGAFLAKVVVTPAGPSALLLMGAGVQIAVGFVLAPPWKWRPADLRGRPAFFTIAGYVIGGVATIGYLLALASGPAAVVVPLVAISPALAGLIGIAVLKEKTSRLQLVGIGLALAGAVLLAR